jgi:S-formylglutathione hydrolase
MGEKLSYGKLSNPRAFPLIEKTFSLNGARKSIIGHSMGGHGALTLYFKYPDQFKSCSAFSPIVAPTQAPWGYKAFTAYLGDNQEAWKDHDATELVTRAENAQNNASILIDQGLADDFLQEQLKPELFENACNKAGQDLTIRIQDGYDHSYFFIQSFMNDHLNWHAKYL